MRVSSYDMYIQNYHMSSEAWSKIATEYPDIKIKTFPKPIMDAMKKANEELLVEVSKDSPLLKEVLDSQKRIKRKQEFGQKCLITYI